MWEAACLCNAVGQPQLSIQCQLRERKLFSPKQIPYFDFSNFSPNNKTIAFANQLISPSCCEPL